MAEAPKKIEVEVEIKPKAADVRWRPVAGLGPKSLEDPEIVYAVYLVAEVETDHGWERLSNQGVLQQLSGQQVDHLIMQLCNARGLQSPTEGRMD